MLNVLFFSILVCSSVFSMQNNPDYVSSEKMKQEYEKKQNEYDKAHQESIKKIDQQMQEYHDRVTRETQEAFAKSKPETVEDLNNLLAKLVNINLSAAKELKKSS